MRPLTSPAMPLSDRVLLGPGPSNPYPEVAQAFARPLLGHLDPEFLALLDDTCERLRRVFRTSNELTLPISGTGSAGMEAAFVNVVAPGDTVVVGVNGVFGERMCDVAARCGAEVVRVDAPWGRPLDPGALLAAHPSPKVIAVVHAETSTGVRTEIEELGRGKGDALLLVDTVTSLGGIPVEVDGWGIDIAYSATQKCLGVPPGLAPLTVSERARERFVERSQSWYLAGLGHVLDEGLEQAWARHAACGEALQAGFEKLGFQLLAADGHRLPQLTSVGLPEGVDEAVVRRALLDDFGIEVGGGLGAWAGTSWRIGCMGHGARRRNVTLLLAAVGELLGR